MIFVRSLETLLALKNYLNDKGNCKVELSKTHIVIKIDKILKKIN